MRVALVTTSGMSTDGMGFACWAALLPKHAVNVSVSAADIGAVGFTREKCNTVRICCGMNGCAPAAPLDKVAKGAATPIEWRGSPRV
jgi:uncharacterized membrane protein